MTALMLLMGYCQAQAQAVVFPQSQQPGNAVATQSGNDYILGNDLFEAKFTKENGVMLFAGSEGLHLVGGTELFTVTLGSGSVVSSSDMTLGDVRVESLVGNSDAVKGSERFDGKQIVAKYSYGNLSFEWRAVLRDGSHYLRTELDITASSDQAMTNIVPMIYNVNTSTGGTPAVVGNTRGAVLASDKLFAGLETPMGNNTVGEVNASGATTLFTDSWTNKFSGFTQESTLPDGITALNISGTKYWKSKSDVAMTPGMYSVSFDYTSGNHRLDIVGVDVVDAANNVVASDYHHGYSGGSKVNNVYSFALQEGGTYTVRYFVVDYESVGKNSFKSVGNITCSRTGNLVESGANVPIRGLWSRKTTLKAGTTWNVSAVVGLMATGQGRRSFLAYSERERAVPWRPFPLYNSWYELNINRKDNSNPYDNMQTSQANDVLAQWKSKLFDAQGVGIKSFVWDDGWDNYGTWECHKNFDFTQPSATAKAMGAGTGVWLSPVGGYGDSGDARRKYWTDKGQVMELSNPEYYQVFKNAATNFINNYNVNFFKFDGISAQAVATGPDTDETGEEDAEGIISMERDIRTLKEDIFLNTTVGTWASPFWYRFTDATWRQADDYGELGKNSSDRENWVTYRDQLVYQHYVQNSPLCPINTLMTHGFILANYYTREWSWSSFGYVNNYVASEDWSYAAALRELRCAFACGSGMVELYCDYDLMNSTNNGALWADLAECIKWQEKNADVLPDIHWVGGAPYDGSKHNIYGWASWNGKKVTLALRNGGTSDMTYNTTLREVFEIPAYIQGVKITLTKAFSHSQNDLSGLSTGTAIDIDQQLTLSLPASTVFVFDGVQTPESSFEHVPVVPQVVADPVFSTPAGVVEKGTKVTISCATEGAAIYYSLDGGEPKTLYNGGEIVVDSEMTIKAYAAKEGCTKSQTVEAHYTIRQVVADPVFSIAAGAVEMGTTVTISCATEGAAIYYSLDGGEPATLYNGAGIVVDSDMTIKAYAAKEGCTSSQVIEAHYTIIQREVVAAPVFSIAAGAVEMGTKVTISCATEGAAIYYSLDGGEPATLYNGAGIVVDSEMTIKAYAAKEGCISSQVIEAHYTIIQREVVAAPVFSIASGEVEKGTEVTISCATEGAVIYYSLDGGEPATLYNGAGIVVDRDMTIKAYAAKEGYYTNSQVVEVVYTVYRNISREIKIKAEHKFGTCILPFGLQLPAGLKAYSCSHVEGDYIILEEENRIKANTPYILYAPDGIERTFTGRVVDETVDVVTVGLLTGLVFENRTIAFGDGTYVLQDQGNGVMFYNAAGMEVVFPYNRCYLTLPAGSNANAYRLYVGTTGIECVKDVTDANVETVIYNLQGRKVTELQSGNVYIINGVKVYIK